MSTLKTHNLQSPDAGSVNIALTPNAGMVVAGVTTVTGTGTNGLLKVDIPATTIPLFGAKAMLTLAASGLCRLWVFNVDISVSLEGDYNYL